MPCWNKQGITLFKAANQILVNVVPVQPRAARFHASLSQSAATATASTTMETIRRSIPNKIQSVQRPDDLRYHDLRQSGWPEVVLIAVGFSANICSYASKQYCKKRVVFWYGNVAKSCFPLPQLCLSAESGSLPQITQRKFVDKKRLVLPGSPAPVVDRSPHQPRAICIIVRSILA